MQAKVEIHREVESDLEHYAVNALPPLQHEWPLLGSGLFALERTLSNSQWPSSEQEKSEQRKTIRDAIIAQVNRDAGNPARDTSYLAFLLVKKGRGGEIIGNPYALLPNGSKQELPYTGFEGYYAGSERTATRPGMEPEEIIHEEADIGAELLRTIKKRYIEHNSWAEFERLKHVLDGATPDQEELRSIQQFFGMIIGQLHVHVYHNPEFALTLSEQIERMEQQLNAIPGGNGEEQQLRHDVYAACEQLKNEYRQMSPAQQQEEKQERRRREQIRANRLAEFQAFRDETYHILAPSERGRYVISIQDVPLKDAEIVETITLPAVPTRNAYPPTQVHLTLQQVEGYLFLAKLGEIGGDPLVRRVYG